MNNSIYSPLLRRLAFRSSAITCRHQSSTKPLLATQPHNVGKWAVTSPESPGVLYSPVNFEPTYGQTIPEFLWQNLHKWEDAPAFECALTGRKYTHGEVYRKSRSFGACLKQHGLKRREAVCILLPNLPEYPIAVLGIMEAGMVVSPLSPFYTVDEISKQINDCQATAIVTLPQLLTVVEAAKERCPSLKSIIVVGNAEGYHSFFDMLKTDPSSVKLQKGSDINSLRETALLPYSSGTTGPPKGVELTHSTFTTNILQFTYPGYRLTRFFDKGTPQERFIAVMPFFHIYGMQIIMANTLFQGAHTLCLPKFEPAAFIKAIKQHKPTTLHLVTPLISYISGCKDITNEDLGHVHGIIAGAAVVGKDLIENFLNRFDQYVFFQEGFGMTELSSVSHSVPPEVKNSKMGSSGVLIPGTSCKFIDVESGKTVGPNQPGELCIRGPQIMKGYYNNEAATNETIDTDGFLRTGDIGYHDDDSFLFIVDRIKELIKVKGLQVAPSELENVLRQHPEVEDVAVIGVKHNKLGEAPRAYIVPKSKTITEKSINEFLDGKVAPHKKLVGGICFLDSIPKAPSGKILRRVLSDDYKSKQ